MNDRDKALISERFKEFAAQEMPWLMDVKKDDTERLMHTTALIAFTRGYEHAQRDASCEREGRQALASRLVELFCGLRRHQVEEAVQLLLDRIDSKEAAANSGPTGKGNAR